MAEYLKTTIKNVIDEINRKYFLPDIQRSFVWKPEQIYKLFDSLMRGYPISTFLFWKLAKEKLVNIEKNNEIKIKFFRFVDSNIKQSEEETTRDRDEYFLVLDGQQRLTSLYISLKGTWIERKKVNELYFNVLSGKEEDENGILYDFKFFERDNGLFFVEKENGEISKIWINVKKVFEIEEKEGLSESIDSFVNEIIQQSDNLNEFKNKIFNKILNLYHLLTTKDNIFYYPEKEEDYNRVLDIFVRTNAGGTKLSYSDLLFSKIKLKWDKAREEFLSLKEDINENDNFNFDIDFILKTCLVIFSKKSQEVRYKIENFKDSKIEEIKNNWNDILRSIQITKDILNDIGIRNKKLLPSHNAVIPIIYYIYKKKNIRGIGDFPNGISTEEKNIIKKWLYHVLLSGVFGGQSDNVLYKAKEIINQVQCDKFPDISLIKAIRSIKSFDLSPEFLEKIKYNSTNSYLILSMIYSNLNFKPKFKGNLPQQDHIFSIDELKDRYKEEIIHNIGNIRFVSAAENNWKKNTPFNIWIKQISDDEKEKHLIPDGEWDIKNYKEFLQKRRELIFTKIKNLIQY